VQYRVKNHGDWRIRIGEFGGHSNVIGKEITRRLLRDLK
jgi:hypothetical protein